MVMIESLIPVLQVAHSGVVITFRRLFITRWCIRARKYSRSIFSDDRNLLRYQRLIRRLVRNKPRSIEWE